MMVGTIPDSMSCDFYLSCILGTHDASESKGIKELPVEHEDGVRHVFTCSQERLMLSASNTVKVMDLLTEVQTHTLAGHTDRVSKQQQYLHISNYQLVNLSSALS